MTNLIPNQTPSSQKEVNRLDNPRTELLKKLGQKCSLCPETDDRILQIDHKLGQGYLEKEYFESREEMYQHYLDHFEAESKYIQILCFNCNTKKRIANEEIRGRASLTQYFSLYKENKDLPSEQIFEKLHNFISENPQFIPIHERFIPIFERIIKFEIERRRHYDELDKLFKDFKNGPRIPKSIKKFFGAASP